MRFICFQIIDTDKQQVDSLVYELPNKKYSDLVTTEVMESELKQLIKSFVKSAKEVYEMEGDELFE